MLNSFEDKNLNSEFRDNGFAILDNIYSTIEVNKIISCIENAEQTEETFLKTAHLFAIRQLLQTIPNLEPLLFTTGLKSLMNQLSASNYFMTKAIYFDKPSSSNWFVAYHQDLSIAVNQKYDLINYTNWTFKKGQHGVQPPLEILKNTITLRIHLDDTNKENGALKVIPGSHINGITRVNSENLKRENEVICNVKKGGIMLMRPLTFHASNRTTNGQQRRVIHLEFNHLELEKPLQWLEKSTLSN